LIHYKEGLPMDEEWKKLTAYEETPFDDVDDEEYNDDYEFSEMY